MEFEFGPNETVSSLDAVPAEFRHFYEKGDEGFTLVENYKGAAQAFDGLNKSLKASRKEAKDLKRSKVDLSKLSEYGETVDDIAKGIKSKVEELEDQIASKANINPDKIRDEVAKSFTEELDRAKQSNEGLKNQLYTLMVENVATAAIAEAKGIPELLMPYIKEQVKVVEDADKKTLSVIVVDKDGDMRHRTDGAPMGIPDLVKQMRENEKFGRLFESDQQRGGGGTNPNKRRAAPPQGGEVTGAARISRGLERANAGNAQRTFGFGGNQ